MPAASTWSDLATSTLARQFRSDTPADPSVDDVVAALARTGPIQSQTARSTFLGLAARLPGVSHGTITAAFEDYRIVRGSTLRGTVHSSTPQDHVLLEVATRVGQVRRWHQALRMERDPAELFAATEAFAAQAWRSPAELHEHLIAWLTEHDTPEAAARARQGLGRALAFGHGGLVRRPLRGGWDQQGAAAYRAAAPLLGQDRAATVADPGPALAGLVQRHLESHGPASRHDLAWWSGLGLRRVDAALDRLGDAVGSVPGPDGRDYRDVLEPVTGRPDHTPRLLPEFDALLCAYDPRARDRFVTREQHALVWNQANGLIRPPVLHGGRLVGWWRSEGTGRRKRVELAAFPGCDLPTRRELGPAVEAVQDAMGWQVEWGTMRVRPE